VGNVVLRDIIGHGGKLAFKRIIGPGIDVQCAWAHFAEKYAPARAVSGIRGSGTEVFRYGQISAEAGRRSLPWSLVDFPTNFGCFTLQNFRFLS
jgi:hypothetical protein